MVTGVSGVLLFGVVASALAQVLRRGRVRWNGLIGPLLVSAVAGVLLAAAFPPGAPRQSSAEVLAGARTAAASTAADDAPTTLPAPVASWDPEERAGGRIEVVPPIAETAVASLTNAVVPGAPGSAARTVQPQVRPVGGPAVTPAGSALSSPTAGGSHHWSKPADARASGTTATTAAANGFPPGRLQHMLDQWMAGQRDANSVAVGVAAIDNGPLWAGDATRAGAGSVVHAGDTYGILSVTKTFIEALVLREAGAGRIDLDAPMPPLPGVEPVPEGVVITPRMLLMHTSGLVDYANATGYDNTQPITPAQTVNLALHTPFIAPQGTVPSYSRTNFHWLGLLLEQTTGRPLADLIGGLAKEVGLTHTSLDPATRPGWVGFASGGVRSTVPELARWGAALFTPGRILPPEQVALLTTIGNLGVGLGTWPLCPCTVDANGARHADAVGQIVADGGLVFFPRQGLVVVVHFDPSTTPTAEKTQVIAGLARDALAAP